LPGLAALTRNRAEPRGPLPAPGVLIPG